ncbi:hypothetical protein ON010_g19187 [Phytophthora cinnamomi]|nr:hypothetical protein ON010_g19187 [Phytophthora cinnamomi]
MKFLKTLFRKTPRDSADQASNGAVTGTLPPIDLARTTRPVKSAGSGEKKPRAAKLTLLINCNNALACSEDVALVHGSLKFAPEAEVRIIYPRKVAMDRSGNKLRSGPQGVERHRRKLRTVLDEFQIVGSARPHDVVRSDNRARSQRPATDDQLQVR